MLDKERLTSTYTSGYINKIAGIIMFWIGIVVFIVTLILFISCLSDIDNFEEAIVLFVLMVGFGFLTISGVILYLFGRSQAKKSKESKHSLILRIGNAERTRKTS